MPRSGAGKKNQHNHRHENGLVGPGRRITRQRSNGHLKGAAKAAVPDTPPLTPTTSADPLMKSPVANGSNASLSDAKQDVTGDTGLHRLRQGSSDSSVDGQNSHPNGRIHGREPEESQSRRYDGAAANSAVTGDVGTLQLASTILKSCPAYDTIAMLILLLQLPPIFLTLVQALFASLTFMPPSGLSMTSVFSLFDVFQGSAGTPSLGTMIAVDALFLGGWFCLWNWARNFALDLAQVQIAITLGGGNAGKTGSVNSVCIVIVLLLHLVRSKSVRQCFFEHILSTKLLANEHVDHLAQYIPQETDFGHTPQSPLWYRNLFAIHIITQAGIAIIRRNVASSQASSTSKISKRADTEASAGAQSNQDISTFDSVSNAAAVGITDSQVPLTPAFKDGKDRAISAKKRRRQANQVRSRQPFWAALASTKVNALREIEISRPSSTSSVHAGDHVSGALPIEDGHVRITDVDCSSIKFEAINFISGVDDQEAGPPQDQSLFVRINGAYWTSTSLSTSQTERPGTILTGEISGLAPNCTYTCSFIRDDDREIAVIMVKTPALLDKDQTSSLSSMSSPPFRPSQHPSSPISTIRRSIATTEAKLIDTKVRASRARRSHKAGLSKLEKEVDSFTSRLKSSSDDTKQRQRLLQAERTMKQNQDATQSISAALDDLSTIPEEGTNDYDAKKDAYDKQCALLATANESLSSAKSSTDLELATFNEEMKAINRQRERLVARQTRLTEQHDRITQANLQGLNEKERKAGETLAKDRDHARVEAEYSNQFHLFHRELASMSMRMQQAKQESQALENQTMHQQQQSAMIGGGPLTPEGNLPGTNPIARPFQSGFVHGFPSSHAMSTLPASLSPESAHASPFLPYSKPLAFQNDHHTTFGTNRARSASNRSAGAASSYSADLEDADPIPPMPGITKFSSDGKRKGSGGSPGAGGRGSPTTATSVSVVGLGAVGSPLRANANVHMPGRGSPGQGIW